MDRLTFSGNFCDIARCLEACGGKHCPDGYCSQRKVWERLRAYEDTGLEPGEIEKCEPVRHGRWIMNSNSPDAIICSKCNVGFDTWKHEQEYFHFCPNCGAKMDLEG